MTKTALAIIIEEILSAGIEKIGVVISPGDEGAYRVAAGTHAGRLTFIEQAQPRGYAHAIHSAAEFCDGDAFLLLRWAIISISALRRRAARSSSWRSRAWKIARSPPCNPPMRASCPTTAPSAASS
ncbi:MAG: hypothetical protein WDN28_13430 [Chthoniobacter sp.]